MITYAMYLYLWFSKKLKSFFACAGPLFCAGFLWLWQAGAALPYGAQSSRCRAQTMHVGLVVIAPRL